MYKQTGSAESITVIKKRARALERNGIWLPDPTANIPVLIASGSISHHYRGPASFTDPVILDYSVFCNCDAPKGTAISFPLECVPAPSPGFPIVNETQTTTLGTVPLH